MNQHEVKELTRRLRREAYERGYLHAAGGAKPYDWFNDAPEGKTIGIRRGTPLNGWASLPDVPGQAEAQAPDVPDTNACTD